jgi:hypothetical protein
LRIEIIRSRRRKKTVAAKLKDGCLVVYLPAGLSRGEEDELIAKMREKVAKKPLRRKLNSEKLLQERFNVLNRKFFGGKLAPRSIRFVTNQEKRYGSCTPGEETIRISHRLANAPLWVLDYVLMHEMTHLIQPNHSRAFWKKVHEYRLAERARGFLMGMNYRK